MLYSALTFSDQNTIGSENSRLGQLVFSQECTHEWFNRAPLPLPVTTDGHGFFQSFPPHVPSPTHILYKVHTVTPTKLEGEWGGGGEIATTRNWQDPVMSLLTG